MIIATGHSEAKRDKVVQYTSGLSTNIEEEVSMVQMTTMEEAYQFEFKVEQKLARREN